MGKIGIVASHTPSKRSNLGLMQAPFPPNEFPFRNVNVFQLQPQEWRVLRGVREFSQRS
ncbi:hypothetical protein K443DRAFT_676793 [Laccaria amethystina LaAM-08-1]|uniref:Uncharacterized protein n=1 Tax=Laccaria amethystina LaAM-08-1 TaxID=1095629 RepID=A0A0C9XZZ4_9AGAR|nr:hypothetical protein K443DRAFT_676793 [Laccaria amethystina LaAM-08-1]